MIKRRNLRTRSIKMLVLDEADEMLKKGNANSYTLFEQNYTSFFLLLPISLSLSNLKYYLSYGNCNAYFIIFPFFMHQAFSTLSEEIFAHVQLKCWFLMKLMKCLKKVTLIVILCSNRLYLFLFASSDLSLSTLFSPS